jgi:ketosteroid isomerase-like protein
LKAQEENKALMRRFVEAQAKGDLDAVNEMMAPDFGQRPLARRADGRLPPR